jgi:large subunit ribosomal protein L15
VIEEPDHFGHDSLNSHNRNVVRKWANLRDLSSMLSLNNHKNNKEEAELNLTKLGINKLLGGGMVERSLIIRVPAVSENAKNKVESVGGKIILDEHSSH